MDKEEDMDEKTEWQLVPVEPTPEMLAAGEDYMNGTSRLGDAWNAMLAASPSSKEDGWKDAVLDKLAVTCMDAPIGTHPAVILNTIIRWHVQVALDPAVSLQAQDLIDKGMASTKEDGGGGEPVGYVDPQRLRELKRGETLGITLVAKSEADLREGGDVPLYASPPSPLGDTPEQQEQKRCMNP